MTDKTDHKVCGVCGHKAFGKNFGAVSCEPCKAFFRRNALKTTLKCHFDNNCKIDKITRKFCSKCRLDKCLSIGMRRDWILNEEEQELKRLRTKAIRKRKNDQDNYDNTINVKPLSDTCVQTNQIAVNNQNIFNDILDDHFSVDDLNKQITDIENNITNNFMDDIIVNNFNNQDNHQENYAQTSLTSYAISDKVIEKAVEFEVSVIPIARPIDNYGTGFNETEMSLMNELKSSIKYMGSPLMGVTHELDNEYDFYSTLGFKFDVAIRNMTKCVKELAGFNTICEDDKISLLKYSCIEVIFLRSILYYDYNGNCLKLPLNAESSIVLKMDYLKNYSNSYVAYTNFVQNMLPIWDTDRTIIDLMFSIILFNPDHPNLINKDVIKLQQHIYMYLMQRYLQIKYGSQCEAKSRFLRLMNVINDLNILRAVHRKSTLEETPKTFVPPLLEEVLDIKPVDSLADNYLLTVL